MKQCEECFESLANGYIYGSGSDENGDFTTFSCPECGHLNIIYETEGE